MRATSSPWSRPARAEKTYERYEYTSKGNTLEFTAPDEPGNYELRYSTGKEYHTLARAPITVSAVTGTLTGPAQVVAGETFKVSVERPGQRAQFHHHRAQGRARRRIQLGRISTRRRRTTRATWSRRSRPANTSCATPRPRIT